MPKFDTSLDSGALTTLAGLGALAYFTRDKKGDKDDKDKKDKAVEAVKEIAKDKPNSGSSYTGPIGNATNDPLPEAQTAKPRYKGTAAGKLPSKPYPLKTLQNEDRPSKPFPTELAARNKAATEAAANKPAPIKSVVPASKPATTKTSTAQGKPVGSRFGDKDRSLLDMARGRKSIYEKSLDTQTVSKKQGGSVRSTASKRGDGIAKRGFTRA